jgi:hypothetical protein
MTEVRLRLTDALVRLNAAHCDKSMPERGERTSMLSRYSTEETQLNKTSAGVENDSRVLLDGVLCLPPAAHAALGCSWHHVWSSWRPGVPVDLHLWCRAPRVTAVSSVLH